MDVVMLINLTTSLIAAMLRMGTPIALASIGEVCSERVGIINLGMEGQMSIGAFIAVAATYYSGSPTVGVISATLAGLMLGLLYALFVVRFRANQIVMGVGMNIFALSITAVGLQGIWGNRGQSPSVNSFIKYDLGIIDNIPIIGPSLNHHTILVYLLPFIAIISWFVLFRTKIGLRMRAIGENPIVADTVGIKPEPIQFWVVTVAGGLSGLSGSYLSLSDLSLFRYGMVSGRGFIALSATIVGNWNPIMAALASLVFGLLGAMQIRLQTLTSIPPQFIQMLPYILVILLVSGFVKRVRPPGKVGQIFERGG